MYLVDYEVQPIEPTAKVTYGAPFHFADLMNRQPPPQKLRLAIVGVGNCASSLVQGLSFYADVAPAETVPGLMHTVLGGYAIRDIEVVAAFDINTTKVGVDLADAIIAAPNNTARFARVARTGVIVARGPTLDGLGQYLREDLIGSEAPPVDVAAVLRETATDVVVSFLPVGSQAAAEYYADQVIEAGCAFVNCMPVFLASALAWQHRFEMAGLPIIGDDIKSQVGATIVHRALVNLFEERGVHLDRTFQLNFGGNTDFKNMLERERLTSKKISKTQSVMSQLATPLPASDVHVGPSDYVEWLSDRKWAYVRLEGTGFGNTPLAVELKLEVWDSPNSAGVVIDAVRCAKLALDRGLAGAVVEPSSYFMKSPPRQYTDAEARILTERFIAEDAGVDLDVASVQARS